MKAALDMVQGVVLDAVQHCWGPSWIGLGSAMDRTWMSLGRVPGWPGNRWLWWDENQTRVSSQWLWSRWKLVTEEEESRPMIDQLSLVKKETKEDRGLTFGQQQNKWWRIRGRGKQLINCPLQQKKKLRRTGGQWSVGNKISKGGGMSGRGPMINWSLLKKPRRIGANNCQK